MELPYTVHVLIPTVLECKYTAWVWTRLMETVLIVRCIYSKEEWQGYDRGIKPRGRLVAAFTDQISPISFHFQLQLQMIIYWIRIRVMLFPCINTMTWGNRPTGLHWGEAPHILVHGTRQVSVQSHSSSSTQQWHLWIQRLVVPNMVMKPQTLSSAPIYFINRRSQLS